MNKRRVAALVAAGLMTPAGLAKIEQAKAEGSWSMLDAGESLVVPPDLNRALRASPPALENFSAFPPGARKQILWWVGGAKRPEARARRIAETVSLAARNVRARG